MTYETFLSLILNETQNLAGKDVSVSVQKTVKNNGVFLDSLSIRKAGSSIAPAICLDPYYEEAESGTPMEAIARQILELAAQQSMFPPRLDSWLRDFSQVKTQIAFRLVSVRENETLLSSVPHVPFLDLALIFYVIVEQQRDGQTTLLIHHEHAKLWNTDASELYQLACSNTPLLLPAKITPLEQIIASLSPDIPMFQTDEITPAGLNQEEGAFPLHVLTNSAGLNGAACILYPRILKNFAELVKDDVYILPSSIHEVLLTPVSSSPSVQELNQIVSEINELDVPAEDRLSNHVYCYSPLEDQIFIPSCPSSASASSGIWNPQ